MVRNRSKQIRNRIAGLLVCVACVSWMAACSMEVVEQPPVHHIDGADSERGKQAMTEYGCAACHTIPGVRRADATVGPSLAGFAKRNSIAGQFPNQPQYLINWIQNPQSMVPGSIMPDVGVPEAVARDMSEYLYTLQHNPAHPPWRLTE